MRFIQVLLAVAVLASACSKKEMTIDGGYKMVIHSSKGGKVPAVGEWCGLFVIAKTDSLELYNSFKLVGEASYIKKTDSITAPNGKIDPVLSALKHIKVGDSATIYFPLSDEERKMVPGIGNSKEIQYIVSLVNTKTDDEYNKFIDAKTQQTREKMMAGQAKFTEMSDLIKSYTERFKSGAFESQTKSLASGLKVITLEAGSGPAPQLGKTIKVNYMGAFMDGKPFDSSFQNGEPTVLQLQDGMLIKGWIEGMQLMREGGKALFVIPSDLGYGPQGMGNAIPPNTDLFFYIELLKVM